MYKVAIVLNENEVAHSRYADTLGTFQSAIDKCNENGRRGNSYYFITFDKFNIHELFADGSNNVNTFDGIIIATNAMDNEKIYQAFCDNKKAIDFFLNENKGIFISSQKKLSNGSLQNGKVKSTGFLPDTYDYYVFDRPEKYSADGTISIASNNRTLLYPYEITNNLIKDHCENNDFIVHRYRSFIIPKHISAFDTLLSDSTKSISHAALGYLDGDRKVLISSRYNKRIVISTMALDWAGHSELLSNILVFITTDKTEAIFVKKEIEQSSQNTIIDSYIIRANIAKLPFRVVSENEINNYIHFQGSTFIFSPFWSAMEVEQIHMQIFHKQNKYFSVYHICLTSSSSGNEFKLVKYSNFSSIDMMKDSVIHKIVGDYLSNHWHKSVWTYSYIISLIEFFGVDIKFIAKSIYKELGKHFTKTEEPSGEELVGNYDNVFNATCQMAEILRYFQANYQDTISDDSQYNVADVLQHAENWIISKVESNAVVGQDVFYAMHYFLKHKAFEALSEATKEKLSQSLRLLAGEVGTQKGSTMSSIDLCRIYQTLCICSGEELFTIHEKIHYIDKIEILLSERQDIYGIWRNISETAEITSMLLDVYVKRANLNDTVNALNVLITKAIEILHSQFNSETKMWSDDLNTTAKAMFAIGAYDRIFSFAINDFFLDLNNHQTNISDNQEANLLMIDAFYKHIDSIEKQKESLRLEIMQGNSDMSGVQTKLSRNKKFLRILFTISLAVLSFAIVFFVVLYNNHKYILLEIWGDWKSYFFGGFIALIITIAWEGISSAFDKKIKY